MTATHRLALLAALLPACITDSFGEASSGPATADPGTSAPETTGVTTGTGTGEAPPTGGDSTPTTGATMTTGELPSTGEPDTTGTSGDDATTGEPVDILAALMAIDGLEIEEKDSPIAGYRYFLLGFSQPADHADPGGLQFVQRMTLLHRDSGAPLVLSTSGYFIYPDDPGLSEPARLLAANELTVEHRFFVPSRPQPADWSLLTIEQAAADLHAIAGAFAPVYPAKWISTGGSKGGMTSVYFRRFYPDDVDGTVAYVAPQSYGDADPRYLEFVAGLGSAVCRQALRDAQRELLLRRPAMVARMQAQAPDGFTYGLLGEDRALETAALELPFTFWQYGSAIDCSAVPGPGASDDELWTFIEAYNSPAYWSDYQTEMYEPYYWQAATQLGYPAYDESNVADLLMYPGLDVAATYVLGGKMPMLDAAAMPDIAAWVSAEGRALLFIYGENDPYTAAAFELGGAEDSYRFTAPGRNHGARIVDLEPADRDVALAALGAWAGVEAKVPRSGPKLAGPAHLGEQRRPPRRAAPR